MTMICHIDKPNKSILGWMSVLRQSDFAKCENKFECNGTSHQPKQQQHQQQHQQPQNSSSQVVVCLSLVTASKHISKIIGVWRQRVDTPQHGLTFKRYVIICKTMLNAILSIPCLRFFGLEHFDLFVLGGQCLWILQTLHSIGGFSIAVKCKYASAPKTSICVICFNQKSNIWYTK